MPGLRGEMPSIRRLLVGVLVLTALANGVLVVIMAIRGILGRIVRMLAQRSLLTPLLLAVVSVGGMAVFGYLFVHREIHEDVLWIRTVELIVPLMTASYALWCIVTEVKKQ